MKSIAYTLAGLLVLMFLMGYVPLRSLDKNKQQVVCKKIFSFPLWSLATIFNGEANACLDSGNFPWDKP
jgi:hypothetical protein